MLMLLSMKSKDSSAEIIKSSIISDCRAGFINAVSSENFAYLFQSNEDNRS